MKILLVGAELFHADRQFQTPSTQFRRSELCIFATSTITSLFIPHSNPTHYYSLLFLTATMFVVP